MSRGSSSSDPGTAYGLVILTSMPFFANRTRIIGEAALAADKPVMIALTPGAAAEAPRRALRELGQFYFDRSEDALRVLALVAEHDARRAAPMTPPTRPGGLPDARALVLPEGALTEGEVKRLLAAYGVQVARGDDHGAHARRRRPPPRPRPGSPWCSRRCRAGSCTRATSARCAWAWPAPRPSASRRARCSRRCRAAGLDAGLEGFSVQPMIHGEAEVIVGARRDPHFGAVVMVGLGGIAVEILKDVALAPAPVSTERARAMLAALRVAPLLTGARGRSPLDVDGRRRRGGAGVVAGRRSRRAARRSGSQSADRPPATARAPSPSMVAPPCAPARRRRSLVHEPHAPGHPHAGAHAADRRPRRGAERAAHRAQRRPRRARSDHQPRLHRPPRLRRRVRQALRRHARPQDRPAARHELRVGAPTSARSSSSCAPA